MLLILLGPPGAGKGTQGSLLADALAVPKISTGDILREALRKGTPLGLEARRFMDAGELVPDTVILGLVKDALGSAEAAEGAIFDGFPRNVAQAEALDELLARLDRKLDGVIVLEVRADTIVERMSGRRTHPDTGEVYHLTHNPPPPDIEHLLVQRPDDQEETVRHRLKVYEKATEPLIEFYKSSGVPVHHVDGERPIEMVQADLLSELGR
ncbi:MAG TPA: adenylate kinase [Longimicrobiaceae bacterium]|nr:adenylate kinase [Longimicrobiaceae bacterium]